MPRTPTAAEVAHIVDRLDVEALPSHLVVRSAFLVAATPGKAARRAEHLRAVEADTQAWSPGTIAQAAGERRTLEAALAAVDRCQRCGAALSDPASVRRGIGPECMKHGR